MKTVCACAVLLLAATATPVLAQGGYVSAALVGDIARFDNYDGADGDSSGGEALGFSLRLGTELGSKWGVELEFVRPSEIESDYAPGILPLDRVSTSFSFNDGTPTVALLPDAGSYLPTYFPTYSYRFHTSQRNTTISAGLWIRQEISSRFSLAYSGGVTVGRTSREVATTFEWLGPIGPIGPIVVAPRILPPTLSKTTTYDAGPFVGADGRIGLTEHVQVVPGVRLHAVQGGILVRPSVGLAWDF
jgi:hypothetical protein